MTQIVVPARILVVDEDAVMRSLMTEVLGAFGHTVTVVQTLGRAMGFLGAGRFDLVLADSFDRLTGAEFPPAAQLIAVAAPTPVMLITGRAILRTAVLAAGFCGVVEKPFDLATLEHQVKASLAWGPPRAS